MTRKKLILDVDTGTDDAVAVMLALSMLTAKTNGVEIADWVRDVLRYLLLIGLE